MVGPRDSIVQIRCGVFSPPRPAAPIGPPVRGPPRTNARSTSTIAPARTHATTTGIQRRSDAPVVTTDWGAGPRQPQTTKAARIGDTAPDSLLRNAARYSAPATAARDQDRSPFDSESLWR